MYSRLSCSKLWRFCSILRSNLYVHNFLFCILSACLGQNEKSIIVCIFLMYLFTFTLFGHNMCYIILYISIKFFSFIKICYWHVVPRFCLVSSMFLLFFHTSHHTQQFSSFQMHRESGVCPDPWKMPRCFPERQRKKEHFTMREKIIFIQGIHKNNIN